MNMHCLLCKGHHIYETETDVTVDGGESMLAYVCEDCGFTMFFQEMFFNIREVEKAQKRMEEKHEIDDWN